MHCPRLNDLPSPPSGKTGWPWTEETPPLPKTVQDGNPWPRISIVTPSYNQGRFIEETIRSVALQGYPDLEYIIIDGGSTDQSVEIIRKYAPWLSYWVSEKDRGQSHAINKGFARATGSIFAWLCSDDMYVPKALAFAASEMTLRPASWLAGAALFGEQWPEPGFSGFEKVECMHKRPARHYVLEGLRTFNQPSSFFTKDLWARSGGVDEAIQFGMDWDLWCRFLKVGAYPRTGNIVLSFYRQQPEMKTQPKNAWKSREETQTVLKRNFGWSRLMLLRGVHMLDACANLLRRYARYVRSRFTAFLLR